MLNGVANSKASRNHLDLILYQDAAAEAGKFDFRSLLLGLLEQPRGARHIRSITVQPGSIEFVSGPTVRRHFVKMKRRALRDWDASEQRKTVLTTMSLGKQHAFSLQESVSFLLKNWGLPVIKGMLFTLLPLFPYLRQLNIGGSMKHLDIVALQQSARLIYYDSKSRCTPSPFRAPLEIKYQMHEIFDSSLPYATAFTLPASTCVAGPLKKYACTTKPAVFYGESETRLLLVDDPAAGHCSASLLQMRHKLKTLYYVIRPSHYKGKEADQIAFCINQRDSDYIVDFVRGLEHSRVPDTLTDLSISFEDVEMRNIALFSNLPSLHFLKCLTRLSMHILLLFHDRDITTWTAAPSLQQSARFLQAMRRSNRQSGFAELWPSPLSRIANVLPPSIEEVQLDIDRYMDVAAACFKGFTQTAASFPHLRHFKFAWHLQHLALDRRIAEPLRRSNISWLRIDGLGGRCDFAS